MATYTFETLEHPKTPDAVGDAASQILTEIDEAGRQKNPAERQKDLQAVEKKFKAMTPVERMSVAHYMDLESAERENERDAKQLRSSGIQNWYQIPAVKLEYEADGDLKSAVFKCASSYNDGQTLSLNLDDKNKSEGPRTEEKKLADGTLRALTYDSDRPHKNLIAVQDSSGLYIAADQDDTWTRYGARGKTDILKDVRTASDQSLSYEIVKSGQSLSRNAIRLDDNKSYDLVGQTNYKVTADGTKVTMGEIIGDDHKRHTVQLTERDQRLHSGKTSAIETTTFLDYKTGLATTNIEMTNNDSTSVSERVIQELAEGKSPAARLDYKVTDNFIDHTHKDELIVRFPDGFKAAYSNLTQPEVSALTNNFPKITWLNHHHFIVTGTKTNQSLQR